jgi:hypothetical protein
VGLQRHCISIYCSSFNPLLKVGTYFHNLTTSLLLSPWPRTRTSNGSDKCFFHSKFLSSTEQGKSLAHNSHLPQSSQPEKAYLQFSEPRVQTTSMLGLSTLLHCDEPHPIVHLWSCSIRSSSGTLPDTCTDTKAHQIWTLLVLILHNCPG